MLRIGSAQMRGLQSAFASSIRRRPRGNNLQSTSESKYVSSQFQSICMLTYQTEDRTNLSLHNNTKGLHDVANTGGGRSIRKATMVTVTKTSTSSPQVEVEVTKQSQQTQSESPNESSTLPLSCIQSNDSVKITPSAIQQIHHLAKQRRPDDPSAVFLRVYVDAGGCSGFQYKFELEQKDCSDGDEDDEPAIDPEDDVVIESSLSDGSLSNVTVVIDEGSLEYIKGSTVDFVREMIRSSFAIVENPQSESACGCGSSFAVKNFTANPALD